MIGALLLAIYLDVAACVGLENPKPPPTLIIKSGESVSCRGVTKSGRCSGVYRRRGRRINVVYSTTGAFRHEYLHDVLCQVGRCSRKHREPEWETCGS